MLTIDDPGAFAALGPDGDRENPALRQFLCALRRGSPRLFETRIRSKRQNKRVWKDHRTGVQELNDAFDVIADFTALKTLERVGLVAFDAADIGNAQNVGAANEEGVDIDIGALLRSNCAYGDFAGFRFCVSSAPLVVMQLYDLASIGRTLL